MRVKRYVVAVGFVGEWNIGKRGAFAASDAEHTWLHGSIFHRAKYILGARRRKGYRAVRVRVVLEEI